MKAPVLVILAAGMGSRYGGLKQIDPVDEQGNKIIDFSIYDALRAGFKKVVFVIKKENLADFKSCIGDRIGDSMEIEYVFQDISMIPDGFCVPEGRVKPWGTAHAALCAAEAVDSPFAVINSDDFYGREAFVKIYDFLSHTSDDDKYRYAMVGFALKNTLTENGSVSRGVCTVNGAGKLTDIEERTRIIKTAEGAAYTENGTDYIPISGDSIVSMNFWGYSESFLKEAGLQFREFLEKEVPKNPLKAEFYLPSVVDRLLKEDRAEVKVLKSEDKWFGVTYREDKPLVVESIKRLKKDGVYPEKLWD
ncbi:MAG: nucleotidyltransferase [Lachnospiraceae bacterium]|nr:nucleotidyltransferase [Lachnospiraceae bacterium]HAV00747.1 nucleotidyltransferase [Lachnospiraceae bacterium]